MIYGIRDGMAVKIGFTESCADSRLSAFQTGNPRHLELLFLIPGNRSDESRCHAAMNEYGQHIRGEWFNLEALGPKELEGFLGEVIARPDVRPFEIRQRRADQYLTSIGLGREQRAAKVDRISRLLRLRQQPRNLPRPLRPLKSVGEHVRAMNVPSMQRW